MLTTATRRKTLEAGIHETSTGRLVRLRDMAPKHLINTYLRKVASGEPTRYLNYYVEAIVERGLLDKLEAEINRRQPVGV